MNNVLLSPIPLEELKEVFTAIVREELKSKNAEEVKEKLLSPKETCELFSPKISLVTLNTWASQGLLHKRHLGGRTWYKQSEVFEAAKSFKKYSRAA